MFFKQSFKYLDTSFPYFAWLANYLRNTIKPNDRLVSHYVNTNQNAVEQDDSLRLFTLLQLLSFLRRYSSTYSYIEDQKFHVIKFQLADFLKVLNIDKKNNYQRKKLITLLLELQQLEFNRFFLNSAFTSVAVFPTLKIERVASRTGRPWLVTISVTHEIYSMRYPYDFPPSFFSYSDKHDLKIKLKIIRSMSYTTSTTKQLKIRAFFEQYNTLKNQKKTELKQHLLLQLKLLVDYQIIKNKFYISYIDKSRESKLMEIT